MKSIAFTFPKKCTIYEPQYKEGERVFKKVTVPGMDVNIAKAMKLVKQHPVNEALDYFSSKLNGKAEDLDLPMMSKLDRLRKLNSLIKQNKALAESVKKDEQKIRKAEIAKKNQQMQQQAVQNHIKQNQNKDGK